MNVSDFFNQAEEAFKQTYGISTHEAGFYYSRTFKKAVIIAKSPEAIEAYLKAQKILNKIGIGFNLWCIILLFAGFILAYDIIVASSPQWFTYGIIIVATIVSIVNTIVVIKIAKLQELYEGKIYLYKVS